MAEQGHWKKFTDDEGFTFEAWLGGGPAPEKEMKPGEGQNTEAIQEIVDHIKDIYDISGELTQGDFDKYFMDRKRWQKEDPVDDWETKSREYFDLEERDISGDMRESAEERDAAAAADPEATQRQSHPKKSRRIEALDLAHPERPGAAKRREEREERDAATTATTDTAPVPTATTAEPATVTNSNDTSSDSDVIARKLDDVIAEQKATKDAIAKLQKMMSEEGIRIHA